MKIALITFIKNKNDCVKALMNSMLLPMSVDKYWVFDKTLNIILPNNIIPVSYDPEKSKTPFDLTLEVLKGVFLNGQYDAIINCAPDIIMYKPDCFISPIFNSNIDFCYIKKSPTEYYVPVTEYQCYSISGRGLAYFDNTDFSKMQVMHNGNSDYIISHFLSTIHPWPLVSQIDETLVAHNNKNISNVEKTVIGKYDNMSNNDLLATINEILEKQNKLPIYLTDEDTTNYLNKLKNN